MLPAGTRGERETEEDLYYCTCPPEYALDADGKTCVVPDFMLLYSLDAAGLRRMSLPKPRLPSHSQRSGADHRCVVLVLLFNFRKGMERLDMLNWGPFGS